jgi:ferredoxin like protein
MNIPPVPTLLGLDHFDVDKDHPHIAIDHDVCETRCTRRSCLTVCPADVYTEEEGRIIPDTAACLECGTCVIACVPEALSWHYPDGTHGVQYRYG